MFADKRPLMLSFCLKIGSSSKSTPFGQDKGFIYLLEVPLSCHRHLLLSLHRPLYSLPLQCLKAELRESDWRATGVVMSLLSVGPYLLKDKVASLRDRIGG